MFISALFTVARTWKQLKCPTIDDWLKKLWYIYTMEYYSAIRKDEIPTFATTWMDLEIIILNKISQTEKVENHMIPHMWDINLKAMNEQNKQTETHGHGQYTNGYQREAGR